MTALFRKLRWLIRRKEREAELQDEIQFHLEEDQEELRADGVPQEQVERVARQRLGNVDVLKEDVRSTWSWIWLEQLLQDIRYAVRTMMANRIFTTLAVVSLALGIGANTAMFSFMDAILLRSLPVSHPEELVQLAWHTKGGEMSGTNRHDDTEYDPQSPDAGMTAGVFAYPAFEMLQKDTSLLSNVFGYQGTGDLRVTVQGQTSIAHGEYVSGEYFTGLGVTPAAGRLIAPGDDKPGATPVAVVSYGWGQEHFGGNAEAAAGQSMLIAGVPFVIAGVTPPEFFGVDPALSPGVFIPMHASLALNATLPAATRPGWYMDPQWDWVDLMARLLPGVTKNQAQAALSIQYKQWQQSVAGQRKRKEIAELVVKDGRSGLESLRHEYSKPLFILLGLVGLILTLACANIANLLLARSAARRRELGIRLSIGAGRSRVIRQLLTESVLLATISGVLGLAFSVWGVRVLTLLLANGRENFTLRAELNWHVLAATAALALGTGVLFGLAPALQSTKVDLNATLKAGTSMGKRRRLHLPIGLSQALIVGQVAVAAIILLAAGLFIRTLATLESTQLGFNRENLLTFRVDAKQAGYKPSEVAPFYANLQSRLRGIPGVRNVSYSDVPLIGNGTSGSGVQVDGGELKSSRILSVGSDFFDTMQIRILRGRAIDEHDQVGAPLVAVVNETFAKLNVGEPDPLGHHVVFPRVCATCDIQIVGLAADARYGNLTKPVPPTAFLATAQAVFFIPFGQTYEIRTTGNPQGITKAVREVVRQADPQLPITEMKTQSELIDESINPQILFARLCSVFAVLALTIAVVGLYGTMSYKVERQTNEIGIRMALGAERRRVIWMVLREVIWLVGAGLLLSVPVSYMLIKLITSFLYGVTPTDPLTLFTAAATLSITAIGAGYFPARRASHIDPMLALRHE